MSQLAFDEDGEPIDLPPAAVGWRVRRMKGTRGAPGLVYGSEGVPLVVPLEMDIEELRREVGLPGRYRLEAIDDRRRLLEVKAAVVIVPPSELTADETTASAPTREPVPEAPNAMAVVMEAMRQNSEMARTIVDRFPAMLEASAVLLKAADGAGLPAREPRGTDDDDDDDNDDDHQEDENVGGAEPAPATTPAPGFNLNALIAQLVPVLITAVGEGKLKFPNLAEMLDWRRAAKKPAGEAAGTKANAPGEPAAKAKPRAPTAGPAKQQTPAAGPAKSQTAAPTAGEPQTAAPGAAEQTAKSQRSDEPADTDDATADAATDAELPPLSPQAIAHFLAIQAALTPQEAALARAGASELSPRDLRAWFEQLSAMSVPDAAARVRALLAVSTKEAL